MEQKETRRSGTNDGESESSIVPGKRGNLYRRDPVEGREDRVTGLLGGKTSRTLGLGSVSTRLEQIAKQARSSPQMEFTTLNKYLDEEWMRVAWQRTRKDAATGIDEVTAAQYERNLAGNLRGLLERVREGKYRAPPVRRVYIPKGDGGQRPIGIPTLEDKVLQRAVQMLLSAVYETEFLDCSYGFRPGRSAHQALQVLWEQSSQGKGCWILDVDIRSFFDTLDKKQLREIVARRVRDGVLTRLIGKWLNAGVWEEGEVINPETGVPQGGVVSPLLSNIYLHEVIDRWFVEVVKPRLRGKGWLIRYADDLVMGFEDEQDARRVMEVLPKRLNRYGLQMHPTKTRLVRFTRPARNAKGQEGASGPGTFDFLGLTHYWERTRWGTFTVRRRTAKGRLTRALKRVEQWCKQGRHQPLREQWEGLKKKLMGHYQYYGITGNWPALQKYYRGVIRRWRKWLDRRGARQQISWSRMTRLLNWLPLPRPRVVHSVYRLAAKP